MFDPWRKQKAQCLSQNTFDGSDGEFSCGRNLTCSRPHVNATVISRNHGLLDYSGFTRTGVPLQDQSSERATCTYRKYRAVCKKMAGEPLLYAASRQSWYTDGTCL